jgi:hypothetical protein
MAVYSSGGNTYVEGDIIDAATGAQVIPVKRKVVIVTDSQFKQLPEGEALPIVEGVEGKTLWPVVALLRAKFTGGAYTPPEGDDLDGDYLTLVLGDDAVEPCTKIRKDVTNGVHDLSNLILEADQIIPVTVADTNGRFPGFPADISSATGLPLCLFWENGDGALTGGDADNALEVTILYMEV